TAARYRSDTSGDAAIPLAVRKDMQEAHDILAKQKAFFSVDWAEGGKTRLLKLSEDSEEFLADLHIAYVAAGPSLRAHIRSLPEGSPERAAWDFIYSELRDRVFGGLEYDFAALPPPSPPQGGPRAFKVIPGGKPPPVPAGAKRQIPPMSDILLRNRMGLIQAKENKSLGGIAAGRHPGIKYTAHNEDRFVTLSFQTPQGQTVTRTWAIDGIGGHEGGEFAAVLAQYVLETVSRHPDITLEAAIHLADQEMK